MDLGPLIALYNATNGPEWADNENWLSDRPLYDWFGLKVNVDGRVTEIDLGSNRLMGSLPPQLGDLDQLQRLDLGDAFLNGVIPREIGRLTQLQRLYLERNELSGPIPHEIVTLPNLRYLNLSHNDLSGGLPPTILASETLVDIDLENNRLTGRITGWFAQPSQLSVIRLSGNRLDSEIPTQIERAQKLIVLSLSDNQLVGEIPPGIAKLTNLVQFSVSNNHLFGRIPEGLAKLEQLRWLDVDSNQLSGTFPQELGDLELRQLSIAGNDFSGCVPSDLQDVEFNDINFANIPVCGEPMRAHPSVPAYVKLAVTANRAQTFAVELGAQWLNDFTDVMGWPAPENPITVFVDRHEELIRHYSEFVEDCDFMCAQYALERRWPEPVEITGAAVVPLRGSQGNALETLAEWTARATFRAMQLEIETQPSAQPRTYPSWWKYGLATWAGAIAIADGTGRSRDDERQNILDAGATDDRRFLPLWELEEGGPWGEWHPREAVAIDLLASQVGLRKLTEFYTERIEGEDWRETFQRVFGISVPDFYELFNQHHRNGYPLRPLPTEGSTQWP